MEPRAGAESSREAWDSLALGSAKGRGIERSYLGTWARSISISIPSRHCWSRSRSRSRSPAYTHVIVSLTLLLSPCVVLCCQWPPRPSPLVASDPDLASLLIVYVCFPRSFALCLVASSLSAPLLSFFDCLCSYPHPSPNFPTSRRLGSWKLYLLLLGSGLLAATHSWIELD